MQSIGCSPSESLNIKANKTLTWCVIRCKTSTPLFHAIQFDSYRADADCISIALLYCYPCLWIRDCYFLSIVPLTSSAPTPCVLCINMHDISMTWYGCIGAKRNEIGYNNGFHIVISPCNKQTTHKTPFVVCYTRSAYMLRRIVLKCAIVSQLKNTHSHRMPCLTLAHRSLYALPLV